MIDSQNYVCRPRGEDLAAVVVVPAPVCVLLDRLLAPFRAEVRGCDPELDAVLRAVRQVAERVEDSSASGTAELAGALDTRGWLSTTDAALVLDRTPRDVRARAGRGSLLAAQDRAGRWWFDPQTIEEELRDRNDR